MIVFSNKRFQLRNQKLFRDFGPVCLLESSFIFENEFQENEFRESELFSDVW
jgi:hypothetical protein